MLDGALSPSIRSGPTGPGLSAPRPSHGALGCLVLVNREPQRGLGPPPRRSKGVAGAWISLGLHTRALRSC